MTEVKNEVKQEAGQAAKQAAQQAAKKRKVHSAKFKAKVGLEAVRGVRTLNEIALLYGVHPVMVSQWKKEILTCADSLFQIKRGHARRAQVDDIERLQPQIAQVVVHGVAQLLRRRGRQPGLVRAAHEADLRDDGQAIAVGVQRFADDLVGDVRPIKIRGVDMVDAQLDGLAQNGHGSGAVLRRPPHVRAGQLHRAIAHTVEGNAAAGGRELILGREIGRHGNSRVGDGRANEAPHSCELNGSGWHAGIIAAKVPCDNRGNTAQAVRNFAQ